MYTSDVLLRPLRFFGPQAVRVAPGFYCRQSAFEPEFLPLVRRNFCCDQDEDRPVCPSLCAIKMESPCGYRYFSFSNRWRHFAQTSLRILGLVAATLGKLSKCSNGRQASMITRPLYKVSGG